MQTNFGEFILQHLEEHGQQVIDRPVRCQLASCTHILSWLHLLLLAQDGCQATDLSTECGTDVLRGIRHQVFNRAHNFIQECSPVDQSTETRDLTSNRSSDFGLVVLQQLHEGGYQIP